MLSFLTQRRNIMKKLRLLIVIPILVLVFTAPANTMNVKAVKVDILDNYDGDVIKEEKDSASEKEMEKKEEEEESGNTASSASTASTAATTATTAATTTPTAATTASTTAATTTPTAATTTSAASTTASTTTTDLPQTGDDDRILITLVIMFASFAVFITVLLGEKFGNNN
jgi:cytoskeletal protein RodZ